MTRHSPTSVSIVDGEITIDAEALAPKLGLSVEELKDNMSKVLVTTVTETGVDAAADCTRLTFRYRDRGQLATIGRKAAVIAFRRLRLKGWLTWWIWGIAHIYFLLNLRNRLIVVTQWLWSYVNFERSERLITGTHAQRETDQVNNRTDNAPSPDGQKAA